VRRVAGGKLELGPANNEKVEAKPLAASQGGSKFKPDIACLFVRDGAEIVLRVLVEQGLSLLVHEISGLTPTDEAPADQHQCAHEKAATGQGGYLRFY